MIIICVTLQDFIEVCAGLTREGIAFKAYTSSQRIEITGY